MDAPLMPPSKPASERLRALASTLTVAAMFLVVACVESPRASPKPDLGALCGRLHVSARDGHAADFLAAAHEFAGSPTLIPELLQKLEFGSYDEAQLDEEVGALDLSVQLLAERSTALHPQLVAERGVCLTRAVECLSALPPAYAHEMLNRWGQWGFLAPAHGPALVRLAPQPESRAIALHQLAQFGTRNCLGSVELDVLSGLYDAQALELSERANLLSVLLTRGDEHDLRCALNFVCELNTEAPRWDLVGVLLFGVGREDVVRAIIDGVGALPWARQPRNWRELVPTNAVVSEIAVATYLEDPSLPRARVAFALALSRREFLESTHERGTDVRDRILALEMLIQHHLATDQAIASAERALRREASHILADSGASSQFVHALAALTTRVIQEESSPHAEALKVLLNDCSASMLQSEHARSVIGMIEIVDGNVKR